jgi:hypothetical protein
MGVGRIGIRSCVNFRLVSGDAQRNEKSERGQKKHDEGTTVGHELYEPPEKEETNP